VLRIPAAALRFTPPADAIPDDKAREANAMASGGLLPTMPRRRSVESSVEDRSKQTVWLIEKGQLVGNIPVDETGISDRTWVELRGDAAEYIQEGQELAVAVIRETEGTAAAGTR
jgi:hypothetical protein